MTKSSRIGESYESEEEEELRYTQRMKEEKYIKVKWLFDYLKKLKSN